MSTTESVRLRDRITQNLREQIFLGKMTAGEPLREIALADQFGVSRIPVRDALLQLTQEGLLIAEPNRGVRVSEVWDKLLRPKMMKVRRDIECLALKFLMQRLDLLDFSAFRENLKQFEAACRSDDLAAVVRYDMDFHRMILRESGHPGLEAVWLPIMGGMRLPYGRHKTLMESYLEHKKIVDAIEADDIKAAQTALKANIK